MAVRCTTKYLQRADNTSLFLAVFFVFWFFGSVHFYWGSAKDKVFRYHTKSRDAKYLRWIMAIGVEMLAPEELRLPMSTMLFGQVPRLCAKRISCTGRGF